jgi:hypothetical protein
VLLHDGACPHTTVHTVETLKKLNFEVLKHPPYSSETAIEGNIAYVAYVSAQNFFSQGVKKIG